MIRQDQFTSRCRVEASALEELRREALDQTTKGLPFGAQIAPAQSGNQRWNVLAGDLPFPLLVIKESALEHNLRVMAEWCAENELLLAPHGKTTMCPQIFERQIDQGAWAITVANISQAQVCVSYGCSRIVIANQIAGASNLASLASLINHHPELECYGLIDSVAGVQHLARGLERYGAGRPINVLLEWGRDGWRTGVRSVEQGLEVWKKAARHSRFLRLRGVEAFEGSASAPASAPNPADEEGRQVDAFFDDMQRLGRELRANWPISINEKNEGHGDPEVSELPLLSIGGSAFLDRVLRMAQRVKGEFRVIVRSGCYVSHDHLHYQDKQAASLARSNGALRVPEFIPALESWSYVQSIPEAGLALLTFGKRDAPLDLGFPKPLWTLGEGKPRAEARELATSRITRMNDQHAFLSLGPGEEVAIGDLVCCGISHPCTAFDKWRVLPLVNDEYEVIDLYRTFF